MSTELFFQTIRNYTDLSPEAEEAWLKILHKKTYKKGETLIAEGQTPRKVAFVVKGLFSQYYIADNGDVITKYFFPEHRFFA